MKCLPIYVQSLNGCFWQRWPPASLATVYDKASRSEHSIEMPSILCSCAQSIAIGLLVYINNRSCVKTVGDTSKVTIND